MELSTAGQVLAGGEAATWRHMLGKSPLPLQVTLLLTEALCSGEASGKEWRWYILEIHSDFLVLYVNLHLGTKW